MTINLARLVGKVRRVAKQSPGVTTAFTTGLNNSAIPISRVHKVVCGVSINALCPFQIFQKLLYYTIRLVITFASVKMSNRSYTVRLKQTLLLVVLPITYLFPLGFSGKYCWFSCTNNASTCSTNNSNEFKEQICRVRYLYQKRLSRV